MTDPAAQPWESKLTSVVVYARGAVCRRLARGVVPSDGRVRVSGLPRSLDRDSLRARVVDTPGVRVSEVRPAVEAEPVAPGTHHELYLEVERLHEAQRVAQVRRDRQAGRIEAVSALRPVPPPRKREDPHRRTPVDAWLDLAGFVDGRLTALHDGLAELDAELRRIEHELGLATDRLARASTDAPHTPVHTTVLAELTVDGAESDADGTAVEVELEYRVPGAVWVPAYRLTHRQGRATHSWCSAPPSRSAPGRTGRMCSSVCPPPICCAPPASRNSARCGSGAGRPSPSRPAGASLRRGSPTCSPGTSRRGRALPLPLSGKLWRPSATRRSPRGSARRTPSHHPRPAQRPTPHRRATGVPRPCHRHRLVLVRAAAPDPPRPLPRPGLGTAPSPAAGAAAAQRLGTRLLRPRPVRTR